MERMRIGGLFNFDGSWFFQDEVVPQSSFFEREYDISVEKTRFLERHKIKVNRRRCCQ